MIHANPDFYATLSNMGEAVLMNALDALEDEDRIAGFEAFVTMIEKEGVPSPFFSENLSIDTVRALGDEDSGQREIEHSQTTFAQVIAEALSATPANEAEKMQQAYWPARISVSMKDITLSRKLLDAVLFEFSSRRGDPTLVSELIMLGANPDTPRKSRRKTETSTPLTCFGEAVAHGQLGKAIALMPHTNTDAKIKTVQHISEGHPPPIGEHQQRFVEANLLGSSLTRAGSKVLEFLDQLDTALGAENTRQARAAVLKGYMRNCTGFGKKWDSNALELLCTKHSPSSPSSLWKDFHDLFEGPGTPTAMTFGSWMNLARDAVSVGCAPVLESLAPMIRQQSINGMCEGLEIGKSMKGTSMGDPFVAEQFKATMSTLAAQGLSMNNTGKKELPLVFNLATSGHHTLAKLSVLLELGMDPHAEKSATDKQPATDFIEDPSVKERWESIVRSYEARKSLHGLLAECDNLAP